MALLLQGYKGVMQFMRTIVYFILLAKYKLYNNNIIKYIKAALY